jgi:hypothetical protein
VGNLLEKGLCFGEGYGRMIRGVNGQNWCELVRDVFDAVAFRV